MQNHGNKKAAKTSALSSGKVIKYEYLAGEEILLPNQSRVTEFARFTCSSLGKAFGKQKKANENQRKKRKAIEKQEKNKEKQLKGKKRNQFLTSI